MARGGDGAAAAGVAVGPGVAAGAGAARPARVRGMGRPGRDAPIVGAARGVAMGGGGNREPGTTAE